MATVQYYNSQSNVYIFILRLNMKIMFSDTKLTLTNPGIGRFNFKTRESHWKLRDKNPCVLNNIDNIFK